MRLEGSRHERREVVRQSLLPYSHKERGTHNGCLVPLCSARELRVQVLSQYP
jgi:hypothetical protein